MGMRCNADIECFFVNTVHSVYYFSSAWDALLRTVGKENMTLMHVCVRTSTYSLNYDVLCLLCNNACYVCYTASSTRRRGIPAPAGMHHAHAAAQERLLRAGELPPHHPMLCVERFTAYISVPL
jgi:hypothetical protein